MTDSNMNFDIVQLDSSDVIIYIEDFDSTITEQPFDEYFDSQSTIELNQPPAKINETPKTAEEIKPVTEKKKRGRKPKKGQSKVEVDKQLHVVNIPEGDLGNLNDMMISCNYDINKIAMFASDLFFNKTDYDFLMQASVPKTFNSYTRASLTSIHDKLLKINHLIYGLHSMGTHPVIGKFISCLNEWFL